MSTPIRVAVLNDYEVVVRGVAALLEPFASIQVVALAANEQVDEHLDVALFDTFGTPSVAGDNLQAVIADPHVNHVAVYTGRFADDLIDTTLALGVRGYLHKDLPAPALASAIERIAAGETVVLRPDGPAPSPSRQWPGKHLGLTEREANVLALMIHGLDNPAIAQRLFVSVDAIKSRLKSLYRKIGVSNRTEAALWGVRHGFDPDHVVLWRED